jgi:hypothetical protein
MDELMYVVIVIALLTLSSRRKREPGKRCSIPAFIFALMAIGAWLWCCFMFIPDGPSLYVVAATAVLIVILDRTDGRLDTASFRFR